MLRADIHFHLCLSAIKAAGALSLETAEQEKLIFAAKFGVSFPNYCSSD